MQRAATIIQRWYRRLPTQRRRDFIFLMAKKFTSILDNCFYVDVNDYFKLFAPNAEDPPVQ